MEMVLKKINVKKSRKVLRISIISVIFILCASWMIPIKFTISFSSLPKYVKDNNYVLLCEGTLKPGVSWKIVEPYTNIKSKIIRNQDNSVTVDDGIPDYINITGNTPEKELKRDIHTYMPTEFVFIGKFSKNNPQKFKVEKWEIVGGVRREYLLLPRPRRYFNIWEIKL